MTSRMRGRVFLILTFISTIFGDQVEDGSMAGLDSNPNVAIDKDTIITRNLKLQKRSTGKKVHKTTANQEDERNPDWSYNPIPEGVSPDAEAFKKNMSECLKEVQKNDKRTVSRLSPRTDSPVHGECLIACVLKRNGIIHNGKLYKNNLLKLISKFYAKETKLMKKLEKNLDRCIEKSARLKDECEIAARLNECTNDIMASSKYVIPG